MLRTLTVDRTTRSHLNPPESAWFQRKPAKPPGQTTLRVIGSEETRQFAGLMTDLQQKNSGCLTGLLGSGGCALRHCQ